MIFCELFFTKLHICSAAIMTIGGKNAQIRCKLCTIIDQMLINCTTDINFLLIKTGGADKEDLQTKKRRRPESFLIQAF